MFSYGISWSISITNLLLSDGSLHTPMNLVPPRDNVSVIRFASSCKEFTTCLRISLPLPKLKKNMLDDVFFTR